MIPPHTPDGLLDQKAFAILRSTAPTAVAAVVETLADAGVRAIELTLTNPGALQELPRLRAGLPEGTWLGVGSVLDEEAAKASLEAGAAFVVCPTVDPATIATCVEAGVPVLPGGLTPTELLQATRLGATAVKLFPARAVGPTYVRDLLAPLPQLQLVPTGGVDLGNTQAFLDAGAVAVGLGSSLLGDALEGGSLQALRDRCARLLELLAARAGQ